MIGSGPEQSARALEYGVERVERMIGRVLQLGVLIAAGVLMVGIASYLVSHQTAIADFRTFRGEPPSLRTLDGLMHALTVLDPAAIIQLGIVLLIATPVARVAFTLVAFAIERDRVYVALSAVVLAILIYGFVWGRAL
jgi:uncharacterized membrane protein